MATELYRKTAIGEALVDALDDLISADKIPPELALKVVEEVGCSLTTAIPAQVPCCVFLACTSFRVNEVLMWSGG